MKKNKKVITKSNESLLLYIKFFNNKKHII